MREIHSRSKCCAGESGGEELPVRDGLGLPLTLMEGEMPSEDSVLPRWLHRAPPSI
jgi:hypothetical protein